MFWLNDLQKQIIPAKGEFTVVVAPVAVADPPAAPPATDDKVLAMFEEASARLPGRSRREILAQLATDLGLSRGAVYAAVERAKREA